MPRLNVSTPICYNRIDLDKYEIGKEIPRHIACDMKGFSAKQKGLKTGETVLVREKVGDKCAYVLGIVDGMTNKGRFKIIVDNNETIKMSPHRVYALKKAITHPKRKLIDINNELKVEIAMLAKEPTEDQEISWNDTIRVCARSATHIIDKTLTTNHSIYKFLKEKDAYTDDLRRYTGIKIGARFKGDVKEIAMNIRKTSSAVLLQTYEKEKEEIGSMTPDDLDEEGMITFQALKDVLLALEIEIERRGLDNKAAANEVLNAGIESSDEESIESSEEELYGTSLGDYVETQDVNFPTSDDDLTDIGESRGISFQDFSTDEEI